MIGVIAEKTDHDVVCEFFELFKTPWEWYRRDREYDVVLCAGGDSADIPSGKLLVIYAGKESRFDDQQKTSIGRQANNPCVLLYQNARLPIYGNAITFTSRGGCLLTREASRECVAFQGSSGKTMFARIGYDLFSEIRTLLTVGQPPDNASMPALELHIAFLRDLITGRGIPLVEIPPVPEGFPFTVCLTHDVDHPSIRLHKWDYTMFGFLYRATFVSLGKLIRGRMSFRDFISNWFGALRLFFVHLGLAKDFWRDFDDRYLQLENGHRSTFFVIPFSNQPGSKALGKVTGRRAAPYGAQDIASAVGKLTGAGCEVGLHGIDAWHDSSKARKELEEIRRFTSGAEIGARMHWLYYDQDSPATLEAAGAAYDSTIGYNQTVGYRAGTAQVYKPLGPKKLLELPLHAMDTALFYPSYLHLSQAQASLLLKKMAGEFARFGGVLTVNWHDRSLSPERLWRESYRDLIRDLESKGAWFATAGQATSWFKKRRLAVFESDDAQPGSVRAKIAVEHTDNLPGLRLRIHTPRTPGEASRHGCEAYVDVPVERRAHMRVVSEVKQ